MPSSKFQPIPLSRDVPSEPCCANSVGGGEGLHQYIQHPRVIEFPEEGTITFRFRRGPVQVTEGTESQEGRAGADFTFVEICDVKEEAYSEPARALEKSENAIDTLFAELRGKTEADEVE